MSNRLMLSKILQKLIPTRKIAAKAHNQNHDADKATKDASIIPANASAIKNRFMVY